VTHHDRVQINTTLENSTLSIANVTRYDQGSYTCHVSNPANSAISVSVKISISCKLFIYMLNICLNLLHNYFKNCFCTNAIFIITFSVKLYSLYILLFLHLDGPDNVTIEVHPFKEHHEKGSDINLTCSADSSPSAEYLWFLNGDQLTSSGPLLRLTNIQMSQSGNYSCQAFNSKTLQYQTSEPSSLSKSFTDENLKSVFAFSPPMPSIGPPFT
uniref:Ig-like domain-containing protein n=1 Tax=Poecilia reticulata TaxID=8081 RepID=A0A3P9PG11_POERE